MGRYVWSELIFLFQQNKLRRFTRVNCARTTCSTEMAFATVSYPSQKTYLQTNAFWFRFQVSDGQICEYSATGDSGPTKCYNKCLFTNRCGLADDDCLKYGGISEACCKSHVLLLGKCRMVVDMGKRFLAIWTDELRPKHLVHTHGW